MNRRISKRLQGTAYHEAGHAVVAHYFEIPVITISIVPDGDLGGSVTYYPLPAGVDWLFAIQPISEEDDAEIPDGLIDCILRHDIEALVMAGMAGMLAEKRVYRRHLRQGAAHDYYNTYRDLRRLEGNERVIAAYWKYLEVRTDDLLNQPSVWASVEAVAEALLTKSSLTCDEMIEAIREGHRKAFGV